MGGCITTGFVLPTRLETLLFQIKRAARRLWQNQPLLLQRQCRQAKSTLPGLIIQPLRQGTRLNEKERRLALMRRSPRWVQMCKATAIQMDSTLTQDIITESELDRKSIRPTTRNTVMSYVGLSLKNRQ